MSWTVHARYILAARRVLTEEVLPQQKNGRLAHAVDGTRSGAVFALTGRVGSHARGGVVPGLGPYNQPRRRYDTHSPAAAASY